MTIDLDDPIALMLMAAAALERSGTECAAYGGLALGMYGEPRETRDADFAVTGVDAERARLALADGEPAQESFEETLFFLGNPLSDSQKKYFGLAADSGPVYSLVSARRGIVPVDSAERRMAVIMYFGAHDDADPDASKLAWAEQHRDDRSDLLLQESAVYEMERQSDTKRALDALSNTIRDGNIALATRELALRVVGDAEAAGAVDVLVRTATNGHHPDTLRKSAVQELLERSDSKNAIDRILKGRDKALAETVRTMSDAVKRGDG